MKIAILGAGAYGTALGGVLAANGYDIEYYDVMLEGKRLVDVVDGADFTVLCIPSKSMPHVLPYLPKEQSLIVATKGILSDKVFSEFADWMIISGPGFANDIKAGKATRLTVTDVRLAEMFRAKHLSFDATDDRRGVLMCGALKNIYAILAGILDLRPGASGHKAFLNDVSEEMRKILAANSANSATVDLACGRPDLEITCYYPSRNYEFGRIFVENGQIEPEKTVEGVSAIKRIKRGEIVVPDDLKYLNMILEYSKSWD